MAHYNPLADYLNLLLDAFIRDYRENCEKHNHPASLEDFKTFLNQAYQRGSMSAKVAQILATKYQQKYA